MTGGINQWIQEKTPDTTQWSRDVFPNEPAVLLSATDIEEAEPQARSISSRAVVYQSPGYWSGIDKLRSRATNINTPGQVEETDSIVSKVAAPSEKPNKEALIVEEEEDPAASYNRDWAKRAECTPILSDNLLKLSVNIH